MAASLMGNVEALRKEIGSSDAEFLAYCENTKDMPWPEFDRLIQIIIREQGKVIAQNRKLLDESRARSAKPAK